ncbi:hypothetical protein [Hymenobacter sp. BT190]|uniref:hypothetical protein n=1 Tax=Hymenobacter sp. BT190 TaxID=2763505 RepID=UPI00165168C1|nr:hypothetical protein [Hymenobacter sp. BT190]MBC6697614.1 hypothetical protein [Hymenobacter sp. BT190]
MEPGSAASLGSSLPIDTTRYPPTETPPIIYRSQVGQLGRPLPAAVSTDTNVVARIRTPRPATFVPPARPRPDATTLPATRSIQQATDQELQALSPVGKLPASPVPRVDTEALPAAAPVPAPQSTVR